MTGWLYHFSRIEGSALRWKYYTDDHQLLPRNIPSKHGYAGFDINNEQSHWFVAGIEQHLSSWEPTWSLRTNWKVDKRPATRKAVKVRYLGDSLEEFDIPEPKLLPSWPAMRPILNVVSKIVALVISGLIAGYVWLVSKNQIAAYRGVYGPSPSR